MNGFWLHRLLTTRSITNYVLEPTSVLVNRRARRAKTDRLDAEGMLRVLAAYLRGDHQVCSMVRVPTPDEEDAKSGLAAPQEVLTSRTRWRKRYDVAAVCLASRQGEDVPRLERYCVNSNGVEKDQRGGKGCAAFMITPMGYEPPRH